MSSKKRQFTRGIIQKTGISKKDQAFLDIAYDKMKDHIDMQGRAIKGLVWIIIFLSSAFVASLVNQFVYKFL